MKSETIKQTLKIVKTAATGILKLYNPKPLKDAYVRYDISVGKWARMEKNPEGIFEVREHFDIGILENVKFDSFAVTKIIGVGCGSYEEVTRVGIARGDLSMHKSHKDITEHVLNLGFDGKDFFDSERNKLTEASKVILMGDRKAQYVK